MLGTIQISSKYANVHNRCKAHPGNRLTSSFLKAGPQFIKNKTSLASTVKDETSSATFQLAQNFWEGETMRCLGAVTRLKRIIIVDVQVYSAALYVEADKCSKELGIRSRGGFFETDEDFCTSLLDGAFLKVLAIRLLRDVEGQQFAEALNKYLAPRMTLSGETAKLDEFMALFMAKKLTSGTEVLLMWNVTGDTEVLVVPSASDSYKEVKPELRIRSLSLSRGLFETFLGSNSVVPKGLQVWAAGAKNLLDYDSVKRNSKKL
ncbi:hypothetical protein CEUSTIGMA_g10894.t1 [Chlamydomonas eustigma]|uniref:Chalcone-flavonone isomerase family protein n=1 Tax=Chlamydomonas eustigma TaxID=1157962 RepID=A0A250XKL1_9CHLO|nr:hypothetical protein CEUSTIGMA_g10894.t1 [Chlamydomonas eustigma]|eukprot:GAX83469.1 hypothetical protein CEUSTIGMA_g10894.t1 [Chlamydomonas eustigma]